MLGGSVAELRLLVEVNDEGEEQGSKILLNSREWVVREVKEDTGGPEGHPSYVCVSYIWGPEREPNPFPNGPPEISTNTLPSLSAVMHNTDSKAFWIDALCIPTTHPAKRATLESMGYIYSQAKEVRVVLSKSSFQAIKQMSTGDSLDDEILTTLNEDKWVQSVWTYQEVVNSRRLAFVCPEVPGTVVNGSHFLNCIGSALSNYRKENSMDTLAMRKKFPSLDALEDLIADWMVAGYTERSALAVMSNMDRRYWNEERNYFYSMIGAITSEPCRRSNIKESDLPDVFMEICESKTDFSFIYSSCARSTDPAKKWKPCAGLLPSILPWHCLGGLQPGHFDDSGFLWLDRVLEFPQLTPSKEALHFLAKWLHWGTDDWKEENLVKQIYASLVTMGFTGSRECLTLRHGLFFPQIPISPNTETGVSVIVSSTIKWVMGAPAIACKVADGVGSYIPGVYAGITDRDPVTSVRLI